MTSGETRENHWFISLCGIQFFSFFACFCMFFFWSQKCVFGPANRIIVLYLNQLNTGEQMLNRYKENSQMSITWHSQFIDHWDIFILMPKNGLLKNYFTSMTFHPKVYALFFFEPVVTWVNKYAHNNQPLTSRCTLVFTCAYH